MFQTTRDAAVTGRSGPSKSAAKLASPPKSRPVSPAQARAVYLGIDVPLLLIVLTIMVFGLLMVYSASWDYSFKLYGSATRIFIRQLALFLVGLGVLGVVAFIDYHFWRRLVVLAMIITVLLLVAVLIINEVRNGAVRTMWGGSVQPSELAKLVTIIYLSVWLYSKRDQLSDVNFGLIPLAAILGVVGGLIFVQPDLSAVVTIFLLGSILFFLAGADLKQIFILVFVALIVGSLVVLVNPTGNERIASYLPGLRDPSQASYHVRRSLEAFVNGGWLGVGVGKGVTKLTGLPVPPTDSIFAVIGEETGVLGSTTLLILYTLLFWRGLQIARRAPDGLGSLLAAGLSSWIVMEALVNMAVMVNLLPFAGNALPFISAGGSSLMVSIAAVGILLNISRMSFRAKNEEGRPFGAVIDLRWRDRRRRVPRPRRLASPRRDR